MKIYQFKTENFRIVVDTEPEHCPDFSFDETEETRRKVESGEWIDELNETIILTEVKY
jgi:hypothetical protein